MDNQIKTNEQTFDCGGGIAYKDEIIEMVKGIEDEKSIKMIYGFVSQLHK